MEKQTAEARPKKVAKTPEDRENQLILLATDLAEKQLANGTASAAVITHFLKLATEKEKLEREGLRTENKLKSARTDAIESAARVEDLYAAAMEAIKSYRGGSDYGKD